MKNLIVALSVCTLIFSCKKTTDTENVASTIATDSIANQTVEQLIAATNCYLWAVNNDSTLVSITIDKQNNVSGKMHWNPYQKDGAIGTLSGKKSNDTIIATYDYMIEGNKQSEEKIFIQRLDKLEELSGPLEDKFGKMVIKDLKKAKINNTLLKVDCNTIKFPN